MKAFFNCDLDKLTQQAGGNVRLRQHWNIHNDYQDACQRLFNAIEPGSYIRPHCHGSEQGEETIFAIRGHMALIYFDDLGNIEIIQKFGSEIYSKVSDALVGVVIPCGKWHTVVSLTKGSILLEVKSGPFNFKAPKFLAPWAPEEGAKEAPEYVSSLYKNVMAG